MHIEQYLAETAEICSKLDAVEIDRMAALLSNVKGRVYMIGLGGSLANCMHMAADLRKLCEIDAVSPDNLAELTAWANDAGWFKMFDGYLRLLNNEDALFVLSVGGGTETVSAPLTWAVATAFSRGAKVLGIVGPNGGETARKGDCVIRIPAPEGRTTPHTEAFQAVIWHALVSHPLLQKNKTKW